MANEIIRQTRNVGTESSPVWEQWFPVTVAEAVKMSADPTNTDTIVSYVNKKIADLIGSATPETLDTLSEIADWISTHEEIATALNEAIANKADKDHIHSTATGTTDGFLAKEDKSKLDGIEAGANNYTHPDSHDATMINEDETHRFVTDTEKSGWTNSTLYTNTTPTVNAIGGIAANSTFENIPVTSMLDKLLYPWVAPAVTATIVSPSNGGVKEFGNIQTVTKLRAVVTKKSSAITRVEFFDGSVSLGAKTDGVANGGTFDFDVNIEVSANKNFTVRVTDAENKVTSANTGTFSFVYPFYFGAVDEGVELTEEVIEALTKRIEAKGSKTLSYTCNNQRMVYAYPTSYGNLSKIYDPNNFDVTGTFAKSTINITGLDGKSVSYNVYVNTPSTVSGFNMKFNF